MPTRTGRKSERVHHGANEARREGSLRDGRNAQGGEAAGSLPSVASVYSCKKPPTGGNRENGEALGVRLTIPAVPCPKTGLFSCGSFRRHNSGSGPMNQTS